MSTRKQTYASARSLSRRTLSAAVLSALLTAPLLAAAQVTPDPHAATHRPGTSAAGNGVPVVNIVAPSAAGVSHNQYRQFNVDRQGLILNNDAGVSTTQLGGYVTGNPNYQAGQSARVIVNEVTSTNPTYLRGYTEVAGHAADVIIANPNGIAVNGAGFINTNRATLTTGLPTFGADGSLSGLHVTGGSVAIEGDGLDASNIDRLDLISRNLTVNGKVWGNHLNVVAGANQVSYADLSAQTLAGEGDTPALSIDVAALGGMYANTVHLIATEAGVGVRNAGQLASQSGDFTLDAAGHIELTGVTSSAGQFVIHGASLGQRGTLQSGGSMQVLTSGNVDNSGTLFSGDGLLLQAGSLNNRGALQSTTDMALQSAGDAANTGTVYSGGRLTFDVGGTLSNANVLAAAYDTSLRAQQLASSGTLAAGLAGDGSLQGGATLDVVTTDRLAANGRNLASGGISLLGSALDLSHAQTQAGGNIALTSTAGDIDHTDADLATAAALAIRAAGTLDNSHATMQASQLDAQAAAWRNAYGTVQIGGPAQVQIGGLLDNTHGNWISAGDAALRAGSLVNGGTMYSGGDFGLAVTGALTNAGTLAAQGHLAATAGSVQSNGVLAAGLQGDGSLAGASQLSLSAEGLLAATGQNVASGALSFTGSTLDLHGANTRAGDDIALAATQGGIDHAGGDLATNGRLAVSAAQALNNTQGRLQAGNVNVQAGSFANVGGQLLQTGTSDTALAIGGLLDNTAGLIASNGGNVAIRAGDFNNTGATIQHAGSGVLHIETNTLVNVGGQLLGNGDLILASTTTDNAGGTLSLGGNATLTGGDFNNAAGTVVADHLQMALVGALANDEGLLQANSADLSALALLNGSGRIKALDGNLDLTIAQMLGMGEDGFLGGNQSVHLQAGSLANAGQIYAGSDLWLNVQNGAINSGALQALGSIDGNLGGALTNDGGRLEAGSGQGAASLSLQASSVSNRNGRIANADIGATVITGGTFDNTAGTFGGQGDVSLNAAQVVNAAGTLVSGGNVAMQGSYLNNQRGTLYAAGNFSWDDGSAILDNTAGSIGAGGTIALALDTLHNDAGEMAANGDVVAQLSAFDGVGRLRAGRDLNLTLAGDYTNQAGNTLCANRDFIVNLAGAFTNAEGATLQSVGALTVNATRFDNQVDADINSADTTLNAGTQVNAGRIEGDTVTLNAGDITNTGTIIGNAITVNATNLTNGADLGQATDNTPYQTALIAAVNQLNLYVTGDLLNRDAMLYTLGDLAIAADASGARNRSVTNLSGDIEAGGDIAIATQQLTNQRRVFDTSIYTLSPDEQAQNTYTYTLARYLWNDADGQHLPPYVDASQVIDGSEFAKAKGFCDHLNGSNDNQRCAGYPFGVGAPDTFQGVYTATLTAMTRVDDASAEGRLLAGGNITINGSVLNDTSTIAAGNNLVINGQDGHAGGGNVGHDTVQNIAWVPTGTVVTTIDEQSATQKLVEDPHREWIDGPWMSYGSQTLTDTVPLGSGQIPDWIRQAVGPGVDARMSAGNAVDISAQNIDNTVVGADGKPVSGVGLGSNGQGQNVVGQGGGGADHVGDRSGAIGPLPGAQIIGTPGQPLPVQLPSNGLYTVKPGSGSPYLVETDPRFATMSGFLGSDYLLNQLGLQGDLTLKRLGDAFYETQLVMEQITGLTGKRYLDGDTDALEQYKALMDAGTQEAKQFNLAVGVALTPEQMASLTQDMVWLVNETVNGEHVLVPVVYLSQQTANNVASGAVIQGATVSLNATNQLTNTGTLQSAGDATIKAGSLLNAGSLGAGGNLSVQAAQDLLNTGAIHGGNVSLAAGNDLLSAATLGSVSLGTVNLGGVSAPNLGLPTGGQVIATGNLTAQAGNNLTLDHANVSAGQNLGLAAGNNVTATASTIQAGGVAQLIAGNDLNLNAQGSTQRQGTQMNGVETTTYTATTLQAGGSAVLAAGHDLHSQASHVQAGDQLSLSAGHDVNLTTVTGNTTQAKQAFQGNTLVGTRQTDQSLQGNTLGGTNGVAISAGHDLNATAGVISSEQGDVTLAAGNNVNLNAGQETHSTVQNTRTSKSGFLSNSSTVTHDASSDTYAIGTQIGANNISVAAGNDLSAQAAYLNANNALTLAAGHDINLADAQDQHIEQHDTETKSFSFFSTSTKRFGSVDPEWRSNSSHAQINQSTSVGNVLSGDSVTVAAGNNLTATNAQIVATNDVVLAAGNNLTLNAGQNTYDQTQSTSTSHTGLMNNGGLSVLIGNRSTDDTYHEHDVTYTGSTVGSLNGNVTLSAGNDVHITGSDVLSHTGTAIVGNNVTIDAAVGSSDITETHKVSQAGINVGIGGAAAGMASAAYNGARSSIDAAHDDGRLAALYAVRSYYEGSKAFDAVNGGLSKDGIDGGINLQVGIGGSSASSTTTAHDETAYGSRIVSGGNVTVAATGGDLNVVGSQIAGQDVSLAAANNLNVLSQQENHSLQSNSHNVSAGVGVEIGTSGFGIYVQAAGGQAKEHGNGITHADTTVDAKGTLALVSGNDATIKGAQLTGNQVTGAIGNNFAIQSEQDTNDYASQQWQAGGKAVIGAGGGGGFSYSQSKIDNHYASVTSISGIQAGDGGFNLSVGGNTNLIGGVIASTADASKNLLDTGSLSFSDIENKASYSAKQISLGGSYSSAKGNNGGSHFAPVLSPTQSNSRQSTTKAGVAQGLILTRDGDTDLAGLDRQPTLSDEALKPFDLDKIQNDQAFVGGLSSFASEIIDDYYSAKLAEQQAQIDAKKAEADEASRLGDTAKASEIYQQVAQMRDDRDSGHAQAIAKSISALAISALGGNISLSSGLSYTALSGSVGYTQEEAGKAMRGHHETLAMKVTCKMTAQVCANLRIPDGLSSDQRIQYLRDNGMEITFVDQIPEGARNITINGILNDEARADHVEIGHVSQENDGANNVTYYVQYNASKGGASDLMQAGYDKFVSPINGDYSATTLAVVDAVRRQGDGAEVSLYAHSWGSIVTRNVLNILAGDGYANSSLTTGVFGAAVRPGGLTSSMVKIAGHDRVFLSDEDKKKGVKPALLYLTSPKDPVAAFVGGTLFPPYTYLDSNSPQHLPGASPGQLWGALAGIGSVFEGAINPHSCYGLNCAGTDYNWSLEKAELWHKKTPGGSE
ncbi:hemagglutinin repeat-containing protein [Dyella mobilis]|uniref:Hemagglutinin repeat-containing protein n=1 Tax=Dyella mobilis TaxID=1849582 RepID=A0ABS2KDY7_9GAMM|nr:hemagglutinin repeat-containing protein [Dyella mobilis]MBM7129362.1 hemagglutinin repeat-containing protein [Dyella mobilis]GLQ98656.1 hemagglutinin-like protein [Dyella mobilis]